MAAEIHDRKQQIAEFLDPLIIRCGGVKFVQFLDDFVAGTVCVRPVKPDARRTLLKLFGAFQRRQSKRDAGERTMLFRRCALSGLDVLPAGAGPIAEDMRMTADHLFRDRLYDVSKRECAGFRGYLTVIDDLEKQIAKLVLQRGQIISVDCIGDLIGFLYRVRSEEHTSELQSLMRISYDDSCLKKK